MNIRWGALRLSHRLPLGFRGSISVGRGSAGENNPRPDLAARRRHFVEGLGIAALIGALAEIATTAWLAGLGVFGAVLAIGLWLVG